MIRRLVNVFTFLLIAGSTYAQYPLAAGCPHGIYIFLDNRIPREGEIRIARSVEKKGGESMLATVEAPKSEAELTRRIQEYEILFDDLGHYTAKDIGRMWNYLQKNTIIDTLPPVNYPVMHLAAGTAYLDREAKSGVKYTYTITYYRNGRIADTKKTDAVSLPVNTSLPVPEFISSSTDHGRNYIEWLVGEDPYMYSFRVFRRKNMAGEFEKITPERGFYNKGDSLFLVMNDVSTEPRTVYEYYIVPLDRLENAGTASATTIVSGFMSSDIPVIRRFDVSQGENDHTMRLYWSYKNPGLVRSISIFRSDVYDSAYVKVAEVAAGDSVYIDHVPGAMENYYYYLVLQGIMNRSFPSAKVGGHAVNTTAPDPPADIAGKPTENGTLVFWKHEDPVVTGYYIYRDQGLNDSLQQISGFIPATGEMMSFTDTSRTLSGNQSYRYAVVAVNDGYQLSGLSEVVTIRPAIPTNVLTPTNLRGGWIDGSVLLVWDDMNPQDEFLTGYNVYRKSSTSSFSKINARLILFNVNTFADTAIVEGNHYEYAVTAVDESGSESLQSTTVHADIPMVTKQPARIDDLRLATNPEGILLSWPAESADKTEKIRVYRYEAGQKPVMVADVPGDTFTYEDRKISKGHLYFYFLMVISAEGTESMEGNTTGIRW